MILYVEHTENSVQQPGLYTAVGTVYQQTVLYADSAQQPESFASTVFPTKQFLTVCELLLTNNYLRFLALCILFIQPIHPLVIAH